MESWNIPPKSFEFSSKSLCNFFKKDGMAKKKDGIME